MDATFLVPAIPDEILVLILQSLPLKRMRKSVRLSVLLVCRKWAAILEPLLFQYISLRDGGTDTDLQRVDTLLKFLDQRPYLCKAVFSLNLEITVTDDWMTKRFVQLLDCCDMIHTFYLTAFMDDVTRPLLAYHAATQRYITILNKIAALRHVKTLGLRGVSFDLMLKILAVESLDHLHLVTSYSRGKPMPRQTEALSRPPPVIFTKGCNVRSLRLTSATWSENLVKFLEWPRNVQDLFIEDWRVVENWSANGLTVAQLHRLLLPHITTLRSIYLGKIPFDGLDRLDFTSYPNLERLSLPIPYCLTPSHNVEIMRWTFGATMPANRIVDAGGILAPNLHVLELNFSRLMIGPLGPEVGIIHGLRSWFRELVGQILHARAIASTQEEVPSDSLALGGKIPSTTSDGAPTSSPTSTPLSSFTKIKFVDSDNLTPAARRQTARFWARTVHDWSEERRKRREQIDQIVAGNPWAAEWMNDWWTGIRECLELCGIEAELVGPWQGFWTEQRLRTGAQAEHDDNFAPMHDDDDDAAYEDEYVEGF